MTVGVETEAVGALKELLEARGLTQKEACYVVGTVLIDLLIQALGSASDDEKRRELKTYCEILEAAVLGDELR